MAKVKKEAGKEVLVDEGGQQQSLEDMLRIGPNSSAENDDEFEYEEEGLEEGTEEEDYDEEKDEFFEDDEFFEEEGDDGDEGEGDEEDDGERDTEARLRRRLARLERRVEAERQAREQAAEESEAEPEPLNFAELITDEDYEQAFESREGFIQVLEKAATAMTERSVQQSVSLASRSITRRQQVVNLVKDFYDENPELNSPARQRYVSATMAEIREKYPSMPTDRLLKRTALQVYKDLGIKKTAKQRNKSKKVDSSKGPRFAKAKGGKRRSSRSKGEQVSKTQKDHLDEVLTVGRR